jgi:hypothetical protein
MRSDSLSRALRLEELDGREAPAVLTVTPPTDHATPVTATVATQGCDGITDHATAASVVVKCA